MSTLENLLNEQSQTIYQQEALIQEYKKSTDALIEQNALLHQVNNTLTGNLNKLQSQLLPEKTLALFKQQVEMQLRDTNLIDQLVNQAIQSKVAYIEQLITSLKQTNDLQPLEQLLKTHSQATQDLANSQNNLSNIVEKLEKSYKA